MATLSKIKLSSSTNGKAIKVAATATAGTALHTAVTGTTDYDEVWLYAVNSSASSVKLTIEFGGVTAPDNLIEFTVPAEDGLYLISPGLLLNNAQTVAAFAGTGDVIMIYGWANRITA